MEKWNWMVLSVQQLLVFRRNLSYTYLLELVSFCHSFPLISKYIAGDASNSDSEDDDGADDDDNEPEENSNRESEVERSRSLTNPSTGKSYVLKAKFPERFRILKETSPEILSTQCTQVQNTNHRKNRRSNPRMQQNLHVKSRNMERSVTSSRQKTSSRWSVNNCNPLILYCSSRT